MNYEEDMIPVVFLIVWFYAYFGIVFVVETDSVKMFPKVNRVFQVLLWPVFALISVLREICRQKNI